MADFEAKRDEAQELLDADGVTAFQVSVIRGDQVDTVNERLAGSDRAESLQALSLLAAHVRQVANSADADYGEVAADAAAIAGRLDGRALSDPNDEGDDETGE